MDCLFCKIINNNIPNYTVYEDNLIKVFLDVNPDADGHMLIVPKKHCVDLEDIEIEIIAHINQVAKNMYTLIKDKLNCDGLTIIQNSGIVEAIKHYHMHLIPKYNSCNFFSHDKNKVKDIEEIFNILSK